MIDQHHCQLVLTYEYYLPVDEQNFHVRFSVLHVLVWGGRLSFGRNLIAICEGGWYVPSEIGFFEPVGRSYESYQHVRS